MSPLDVVERYFTAWNNHDAATLVTLFTNDGSFCDASMSHTLRGPAITEHAINLWSAFPDLIIDRRATMSGCGGEVAAQWILRGTHEGSFMGLQPAGFTVSLPGIDVIIVEDDRLRSVRSYFDSRNLFEQLGMQVIVQPPQVSLPLLEMNAPKQEDHGIHWSTTSYNYFRYRMEN